jgi:hypothetical protein
LGLNATRAKRGCFKLVSTLTGSVLLTQYCSGDKIEKSEMGGSCSAYGREERRVHGFGGKPEGKRPLGRPWRRWEDNIKIDLQEVGCGGMDWIGLVQDMHRWWAVVNAVMNLRCVIPVVLLI